MSATTFDRIKLRSATGYGPVNAWAFRKILKQLNLPKDLHFVDLGSGMGRACILAGEFGFAKVTGVELAADLCSIARENISSWGLRNHSLIPIEIIQADVADFCDKTRDDVFFMFRPFAWDFFQLVIAKLSQRAVQLQKPLIIIYCDRMNSKDSYAKAISENPRFRKLHDAVSFGYAFYAYQCNGSTENKSIAG